ncbi:MAG: patatin-like phospholipase family protein [Bacteroidales bacterium]
MIFKQSKKKRKDVALVLSSGGARGIAHIGVINALEKHGYNITSISGSSMGALVGGIYAAGSLKTLEDWVKTLTKMEVFKLMDFTISTSGLLKGEKLITELEDMIPDRNIEELDIPYCAVATDIINEEEVVFTKGKLYDAIRASISIPTVLKPYVMDGRHLVDGGVMNPIPSNRVERSKTDLLVVSNVNSRLDEDPGKPSTPEEAPTPKISVPEDVNMARKAIINLQQNISKLISPTSNNKTGIFNLMNRSISLMLHIISENSLREYPPDILVQTDRNKYGTFDFYKSAEIIQYGEDACEEALKQIQK